MTEQRYITEIGIVSYPYVAEPQQPKESNRKPQYSVDLYISKEEFQKSTHMMGLYAAVLSCGRDLMKNPNAAMSDFKSPFMDTDTMPELDDRLRGCIRVRAKNSFRPLVVGPDNAALSAQHIRGIKGGDFGRMQVTVYSYNNILKGVNLSLEVFQLSHTGEALSEQGSFVPVNILPPLTVTEADSGTVGTPGLAAAPTNPKLLF